MGTIKKQIPKVKIPQRAKDAKIKEFLKTYSPKQIESIRKKFEFIFPEYYPAIEDMQVSGHNLLIRTYAQNNGKRVYYKTTIKGKSLKAIGLAIEDHRLSYFAGDTVFYLKENPETESWELYKEKI